MKVNSEGFYVSGKKKNVSRLENGKFIFSDFTEYGSQLNIVLKNLDTSIDQLFETNTRKNPDLMSKLKLDFSGTAEILEGNFSTSRQEGPIFDLTAEEKNHFLIKIKWNEKAKGLNLRRSLKGLLYLELRSSDDGKMGVDYIIVPMSFKAISDII